VDSDTPLKVAFRVRTRDLLPLTDDTGAKVVSALAIELSAGRRTVDLVLRCFEYAAVLAVRFKGPVLTTVMYLWPPAPRELVYRQAVGGSVVNEWRFGVVRLWEQSPTRLLALGPGGRRSCRSPKGRACRSSPRPAGGSSAMRRWDSGRTCSRSCRLSLGGATLPGSWSSRSSRPGKASRER